jgi:hypothetical protein
MTMLAFALIPTGTTTNHGFDIDEVNSRRGWRGAGPFFLARDKERSLIKPQGAKVPIYWSRC